MMALSKSGNYKRLTRNDYFSNIALLVSQRSTCLRRHVGAIIVNDDEILSTGYNGAPTGLPHCLDKGCQIDNGHCIRSVHAEQNAIIQLIKTDANHYNNLELYVTDYPCKICAKMIVQANIKKIYFVRRYSNSVNDEYTNNLFKEAGIKVINYYPKNYMFLGNISDVKLNKINQILNEKDENLIKESKLDNQINNSEKE